MVLEEEKVFFQDRLYLPGGWAERIGKASAKKALELLAADDSGGRSKPIQDSAEEKLKQLGSNPQ